MPTIGGAMKAGAGKEKIKAMILARVRHFLSYFLPHVPTPPTDYRVVKLLASLGMTPNHVHHLHKTFRELKEHDDITLTSGPDEVSTQSMSLLVRNRRVWVAKILQNVVELGGFSNLISWDGFLYVLLRFCSLSKMELCQVMFYIIAKEMKSWTVNSLTTSQLEEYYEDYVVCPIEAFNTATLDFSKLPLARYRVHEFIELVYRHGQLINPCLHLQRSLQQALPHLDFWKNFDNIKQYNRKMPLDFFRHQKLTSIMELLTGLAPTEETPLIVEPMSYKDREAAELRGAPVLAKRHPSVESNLPLPLGPAPGVKMKPEQSPPVPAWIARHIGLSSDPMWELEVRRAYVEKSSLLGGVEIPRSIQGAKDLVLQTHASAYVAKDASAAATQSKEHKSAIDELRRAQELDFIRKSRQGGDECDSIITIIGKASPCEMIKRPAKKVAGFT